MSEREFAVMECERNAFVDAYFKARPQLMRTTHEERLVEAGFTAAWNTRPAPAPVAVPEGWSILRADMWIAIDAPDGSWTSVRLPVEGQTEPANESATMLYKLAQTLLAAPSAPATVASEPAPAAQKAAYRESMLTVKVHTLRQHLIRMCDRSITAQGYTDAETRAAQLAAEDCDAPGPLDDVQGVVAQEGAWPGEDELAYLRRNRTETRVAVGAINARLVKQRAELDTLRAQLANEKKAHAATHDTMQEVCRDNVQLRSERDKYYRQVIAVGGVAINSIPSEHHEQLRAQLDELRRQINGFPNLDAMREAMIGAADEAKVLTKKLAASEARVVVLEACSELLEWLSGLQIQQAKVAAENNEMTLLEYVAAHYEPAALSQPSKGGA